MEILTFINEFRVLSPTPLNVSFPLEVEDPNLLYEGLKFNSVPKALRLLPSFLSFHVKNMSTASLKVQTAFV